MTAPPDEYDLMMQALDLRILGFAGCHAVSTRLGKMCERKAGHEGRHGWMGRHGWESWTKCTAPEAP